jgi:hypothetical protein
VLALFNFLLANESDFTGYQRLKIYIRQPSCTKIESQTSTIKLNATFTLLTLAKFFNNNFGATTIEKHLLFNKWKVIEKAAKGKEHKTASHFSLSLFLPRQAVKDP